MCAMCLQVAQAVKVTASLAAARLGRAQTQAAQTHTAASKLASAATLPASWAHWKALVARTKACRALVSLLLP